MGVERLSIKPRFGYGGIMQWWKMALGLLLAGPVAGEELVLTFTGDLMAHDKNQEMGDYGDIYRSLAPWLLQDDWSFINLETPVDGYRAPSGYPLFNARPTYVEAAIRGGFQVFSLANNHSNDFGVSSVEGTLATMKQLAAPGGVYFSGLKETAGEVPRPVVLEKKGWKVGFVALTNLLNLKHGSQRVNLVQIWDIWSKKAYPEEQEALLDLIRMWRQGLDFLVVSLHDGVEYAEGPSPTQVEFYQKMVAAGVDVLWGSHPHVLQPWKWVETDRGKRVLLYSMGNFVSNQTQGLGPLSWASPWAKTGDGALFQVQLTRKPSGVEVQVLRPVLLNNYRDPEKGIVVVPTRTLIDEGPQVWRDYYRHRWDIQAAWALPGD